MIGCDGSLRALHHGHEVVLAPPPKLRDEARHYVATGGLDLWLAAAEQVAEPLPRPIPSAGNGEQQLLRNWRLLQDKLSKLASQAHRMGDEGARNDPMYIASVAKHTEAIAQVLHLMATERVAGPEQDPEACEEMQRQRATKRKMVGGKGSAPLRSGRSRKMTLGASLGEEARMAGASWTVIDE